MSYDLDSLIKHMEANPELVAQSAKKVRLEMNASYALGYRIDPEFGIGVKTEEPDYVAGAEFLAEWSEHFSDEETSLVVTWRETLAQRLEQESVPLDADLAQAVTDNFDDLLE